MYTHTINSHARNYRRPGVRLVVSAFVALMMLGSGLIAGMANAQVAPANVFSYQGRVLNDNGVPVADLSLGFQFRLFDSLVGGTCLWSNDSSTCASNADQPVGLTDGLFSENLGATGDGYAAILDSVFANDASVFLEVEIGGETLTPRKPLAAVPYALNAQTLDGLDSSDFFATTGEALDDVYDADGDKVLDVDNAAGLTFDLTTTGDFIVQNGGGAFATFENTGLVSLLEGLTIGDSNADLLTFGTGTWSAAGDVDFALGGGVNAINFGSDALSVDVTNTRIGIGTSTPLGTIHAVTEAAVTQPFIAESYSTGGDNNIVTFQAASGTQGVPTTVGNGDRLASIQVNGHDGSAFQSAATIEFQVDGVPGAGDMPGRIQFLTSPDGSATPLERMRISQNGTIGINTTTPNAFLDIEGPEDTELVRLSDSTNADFAGFFTGTGDPNGIVNAGGGEGSVYLDQTGAVWVNTDGATAWADLATGGGGGTPDNLDEVYTESVADGDTILDVNDASGLTFNLATTGDFLVQTGAVTFATFNDAGNVLFANDVTLGSSATDNVVFNADVNSNIIPNTNDTFTLGSDTQRWADLFLGPGSLRIGASGDQSIVSYNTASDLLTFQNSADSATGFQFLDADGGTPIVNVDTTNERVGIGTAAPSVALDVVGATTISGLLTANGGITADGGVFTVADTSGNLHTSGTLDVDGASTLSGDITFDATTPTIILANAETLSITDGTNTLFSLADAGTTGNATISGTLAVNGDSITSDGTLVVNGATGLSFTTSAGVINLQAAGAGTASNVQIGVGGAGSTTPDTFLLDVKSDAGDPAGVNGASYYSEDTNSFRCFENGVWKDCDTGAASTSLQDAYDNGATITTAGSTDIAFNLASGGFTVTGTDGISFTPTAASTFTSGGALTLTGGAASTWGTTTGNLNLQVAGPAATANVQIGAGGGGSTTPDVLVVDAKSNAGDPAPVDGGIYYNANTGAFRIAEGGVWKTVCNQTDQACGAGTGSALSAISAAEAGNTIDNANFAQVWNWALTADTTAFTFGETTASTGGTGSQSIVDITTSATSTAAPLRVISGGTANTSINLASTGDFVVQDNASTFLTLSDTGAYSYTLDATDDPAYTITNSGSGNVITNLADTGDFVIQDAGSPFATFSDAGLITFAGNLDATSGVDVTGADLTVGGANFTVAQASGNITTAGTLAVNGDTITSDGAMTLNPLTSVTLGSDDDILPGGGTTDNLGSSGARWDNIFGVTGDFSGSVTVSGDLAVNDGDVTTTAATATLFNANATTVNIGTAANTINLAGGSGGTGCTIDGTTGTITCSAAFSGPGAFTTLSSTGTTTLGNGTATVAIDSSDWDISATGAMTLIDSISNTSANLALSTVTSGDITATTATTSGLLNVLTGNLKVGNGTPGLTQNGEDGYVEGTFEVDGQSQFDGNVDTTAGLDVTGASLTVGGANFTATTAGALTMAGTLAVNGDTITSDGAMTLNPLTSVTLGSDDDILPGGGTTDNIGSSGSRWDNVFGVTGDFSGTITSADFACTDCLDFDSFEDTLDLDANLQINADAAETFVLENTGTGSSFRVNSSAADAAPFIVDASGNVGILNDTTPSAALTVGASDGFQVTSTGLVSITVSGGPADLTIDGDTSPDFLFANGFFLGFNDGANELATLVDQGTFGQWQMDTGTTAALPSYSWQADTDTGMFRNASGFIGFSVGGVENVTISGTGTGRLGVGDTSPDEALDVVGGGLFTDSVASNTANVMMGFVVTNSAAVGGAGLGVSNLYQIENSASSVVTAGTINVAWGDATSGAEDAEIRFSATVAGALTQTMVLDGQFLGLGCESTAPDSILDACGDGVEAAEFNRNTNDGVIINLQQAGSTEGTISVAGTTVSYNAFTGSHYGIMDHALNKGEVVVLNGNNTRFHDNPDSEIIYGIEASSLENDPRVFGAFLAAQEPSQPISNENPYLVMAVGNGEAWVVDEGEDIAPGDPLITSSTTGHARKDDASHPVSFVFAHAAESVDWDAVTETTMDGKKHKRISILFSLYRAEHAMETVASGASSSASGLTGSLSALNMSGNIFMQGNQILEVGRIAGMGANWSIETDGTFRTEGLIKTVIRSYQDEDVETVAVTSPDVQITLVGTAELTNGEAVIDFESIKPTFNDVIDATAPVRVVVTPNGPASLYVINKSRNGFTVRQVGGSDSGITFDWMVSAYRKDYGPTVVTGEPEAPPAEEPPAEEPPVVEEPPAETPPAEEPAPETPPAEDPAPETPPAEEPPVVEEPPAETPPAETPPVVEEPTAEPITPEEPPAPSAEDPAPEVTP